TNANNYRGDSSMGRATAFQAVRCGFEPRSLLQFDAAAAQRIERDERHRRIEAMLQWFGPVRCSSFDSNGGRSSAAEPWDVTPEVVGSNPTVHPKHFSAEHMTGWLSGISAGLQIRFTPVRLRLRSPRLKRDGYRVRRMLANALSLAAR